MQTAAAQPDISQTRMRTLSLILFLLIIGCPRIAAAQAREPRELLPAVVQSYPPDETHFLWVATRVEGSDSVQIRMLLTTHGAPGWTATDSTARARIGLRIEALRGAARTRNGSFAFLLYGVGGYEVECTPGQPGFRLNGEHWEWAPNDSLLVVSLDRIDGVGGPPALRAVRVPAPFSTRTHGRDFRATVSGVVPSLQQDAVAGPVLRADPERR